MPAARFLIVVIGLGFVAMQVGSRGLNPDTSLPASPLVPVDFVAIAIIVFVIWWSLRVPDTLTLTDDGRIRFSAPLLKLESRLEDAEAIRWRQNFGGDFDSVSYCLEFRFGGRRILWYDSQSDLQKLVEDLQRVQPSLKIGSPR
jgi:hypothetical protein